MPVRTAVDPAALKRSADFLTYFVVAVMVFVAVTLIGYGELSQRDYLRHHRQLAEKSVEGAARLVETVIAYTSRNVTLFALEHRDELVDLAANPQDDQAYEAFRELLRTHFPNLFAFSVADYSGDILLTDFEGRIDEVCADEIRHFVSGDRQDRIFIHPHPFGYHFDVLAEWRERPGASPGAFFVSFLPDVLARVLGEMRLPGHDLLLVHRARSGLIEVSPDGSRDRLERDFFLSPDERGRALATSPVPGTLWDVVDVPHPDLFSRHAREVRVQATLVFGLFLLLTLYLAFLIRREERKRNVLETALTDSHHQLEVRVEQRTRDLEDANARLRTEIGERRKVENSLRERDQGTRDGLLEVLWEWDPDRDVVRCSRELNRLQEVGAAQPATLADLLSLACEPDRNALSGALSQLRSGETDSIRQRFAWCATGHRGVDAYLYAERLRATTGDTGPRVVGALRVPPPDGTE